jgi:serine/threonine protein kinase
MIDYNKMLHDLPKDKLSDDFDIELEAAYYSEIEKDLEDLLSTHEIEKALGTGGSGTVFQANYIPVGTSRCIKFPRKAYVERLSLPDNNEDKSPRLNPERHALERLNHPNIVRMHTAVKIQEGIYVLVMDCIPDCKDLDDFLKSNIKTCVNNLNDIDDCTSKNNSTNKNLEATKCFKTESPHEKIKYDLKKVLSNLCETLFKVSIAMNYMHTTSKIYHFDIKPSNILVDANGTPFITDLGFARDTNQYSQEEEIEIGFTWKYAHPTLRDPYVRGARLSRTPAKARAVLKGKNLSQKYDLFSFGRTLQELLMIFEKEFGEGCHTIYDFNYLHILACLLLDGTNSAVAPDMDQRNGFVSDFALNYHPDFFREHAITKTPELVKAFSKLRNVYQLEAVIPELNSWHPETINGSDIGPVVFTERVKLLVNHQIFKRLSEERQLGVLDQVFPTATHTRYNHSIGTYHAACQYVLALYNDPEVPVFKIVATVEDIKNILVTALVHDLGQSSLGHDLEEANEQIYSHTKFAIRLLDDRDLLNEFEMSLAEIIEMPEPMGWGIDINAIKRLINKEWKNPIEGLLVDCIDGVIDADKLDYLIRDSVDCRVNYGRSLDVHRFLRALTTSVPQKFNNPCRAYLTIRAKGRASAEAFAFSRYQLFSSLYWHHTYRAIKGMLLDAASRPPVLPGHKKKKSVQNMLPLVDQDILKDLYYYFVIKHNTWEAAIFHSYGDKSPTKKTIQGSEPDNYVKKERALEFLWRIGDDNSKKIISRISQRKIYRRIFELSVDRIPEGGRMKLAVILSPQERRNYTERVRIELLNALESIAQSISTVRLTDSVDKLLQRLSVLKSDDTTLVLDCPLRGWIPSGSAPYQISDYRRKFFAPTVGSEDKTKNVWEKIIPELMRTSAMFRVYCQKELSSIVYQLMKAHQVTEIVRKAIPVLFPGD